MPTHTDVDSDTDAAGSGLPTTAGGSGGEEVGVAVVGRVRRAGAVELCGFFRAVLAVRVALVVRIPLVLGRHVGAYMLPGEREGVLPRHQKSITYNRHSIQLPCSCPS